MRPRSLQCAHHAWALKLVTKVSNALVAVPASMHAREACLRTAAAQPVHQYICTAGHLCALTQQGVQVPLVYFVRPDREAPQPLQRPQLRRAVPGRRGANSFCRAP